MIRRWKRRTDDTDLVDEDLMVLHLLLQLLVLLHQALGLLQARHLGEGYKRDYRRRRKI